MKPAQGIRLVKDNLALSVAIWRAAQRGQINAAHVLATAAEGNPPGTGWPAASPLPNGLDVVREIDYDSELVRAVGNQVRSAFTLSVLQAQRSMETVFSGEPLDEESPDLQAARCALHLLDRAVAPDLLSPRWSCQPKYRRLFEVRPIRFFLDAAELNGRGLNWDHFGGLEKYLDLLEYCAEWADQLEGSTAPVETAVAEVETPEQPAPASSESIPEEPRSEAAGEAKDSLQMFVDARCELGGDLRTTAKELYSGYVDWCEETGNGPVAQRSFGMRLTAMGLQRRRRGRGRHWWEGIRITGLAEVPSQVNGNHEGEFQLRY